MLKGAYRLLITDPFAWMGFRHSTRRKCSWPKCCWVLRTRALAKAPMTRKDQAPWTVFIRHPSPCPRGSYSHSPEAWWNRWLCHQRQLLKWWPYSLWPPRTRTFLIGQSFYTQGRTTQVWGRLGNAQLIKRLCQQQALLVQSIFGGVSSRLQPWPRCYIIKSSSFLVRKRPSGRKDSVLRMVVVKVSAELCNTEAGGKKKKKISNTEPVFIENFDNWFTVDFFFCMNFVL